MPPQYQSGQFCDYYADGAASFEALRSAGALLVVQSLYLDALLSQWQSERGTDAFTTTHLVDEGAGRAPEVRAPLTANATSYARPSAPLGSVFAVRPPGSIVQVLPAAASLVPLWSYVNPSSGERLTTTQSAPPGYQDAVGEGGIYPCAEGALPPPHAAPLYRYRVSGAADAWTTTQPPPSTARCVSADPTAPVVIEGYLPILEPD